MPDLFNVTLLCVETRSPSLALWAMRRCLDQVRFAKAVLITDLAIDYIYPIDIEIIAAPPITKVDDYSLYILSNLIPLIKGTHVLIMQWDSFITNPQSWVDIFLDYDYIGAPWPHHPDTPVGNGGFSLRSIKLIQAMQSKKINKRHPEDQCICIDNRLLLENEFGIKFAPLELANKFSVERGENFSSFGMHGIFNFPCFLNYLELVSVFKIIPNSFLGNLDTYDLIEALLQKKYYLLSSDLLKRTPIKNKFLKKYFKFWFRIQQIKLLKFMFKAKS